METSEPIVAPLASPLVPEAQERRSPPTPTGQGGGHSLPRTLPPPATSGCQLLLLLVLLAMTFSGTMSVLVLFRGTALQEGLVHVLSASPWLLVAGLAIAGGASLAGWNVQYLIKTSTHEKI